jgi:hypothetical protein
MSAAPLQIMLALLMAVPLHFCCWMGLMKVADTGEAYMACRQFLLPEELPAEPEPAKDRHCECCEGTLQRDVASVARHAPRPVLHELPFVAWDGMTGLLLPVQVLVSQRHHLHDERPPPQAGVPLYQRHCALLI